MKNCSVFLLVLCLIVYAQACYYEVLYRTKSGSVHYLSNYSCKRLCMCVKNVNTHEIYSLVDAGVTRLFSSSDCTGNYQVLKGTVKNGEWVNSISYGPSSGSSSGPNGCPNSFPQ